MLRYMIACLLVALLLAGHGYSRGIPPTGAGASASSYVGPGDIVSGATAWWGLRAYNAAKTGTNAADIFCVTATTTNTIKTLTNGNFDVATLTTACPADTYHIAKLYDQTGNGNDIVQATDGTRPTLTLNCINTSLPCATFGGSACLTTAGAVNVGAQPFSTSWVGARTSGVGFQVAVGSFDNALYIGFANSANTPRLATAANAITTTSNDNVNRAWQGVFNGASSVLSIDGVDTTGTLGTVAENSAMAWSGHGGGANCSTADKLIGRMMEGGAWPSGFSSANRTAMCHNQFAYWATAVSC